MTEYNSHVSTLSFGPPTWREISDAQKSDAGACVWNKLNSGSVCYFIMCGYVLERNTKNNFGTIAVLFNLSVA